MGLFLRMKLHKLQKWENYLAFVEKMDRNTFVPLEQGSDAELTETTAENLFGQISLYATLLEKYDLKKCAGDGTDFEKTVRIMQWLTDNTFYSGAAFKWKADNPLDILEYAYGQDFSHAICCREKAVVFTDCLLALQIFAYPICLLSTNGGCHFVTHVYCRELQKWLLFDPSFNCWFTKDGKPLSVWDLKNLYLNDDEPILENYSFNHTDRCREIYLAGFIKQNLTNLSTWHDNSMDRRNYKKNDWESKKEFKTKLPDFKMM